MEVDEIYNILRENFHSKSGLFLNKGQAYEVAQIIKEKSMISEVQRSVNFEREDQPTLHWDSLPTPNEMNKRKEK